MPRGEKNWKPPERRSSVTNASDWEGSGILQNQALEITANLRPNPSLGADSQFIPIFSPGDFSADDLNLTQQFDIGISYLFERGHKRQRRLQAARDQTALTRAQVTDAERTLAFNVGQQFISVLLAESTLQFAQQDLKDFQTTVDIANAQFKAGAISEGDYLKIKLQLLQFQTDVSSPAWPGRRRLSALEICWAMTPCRQTTTSWGTWRTSR
jgi:cobalt-zinc-cadmium efflux system outer membrane protein